MNTLLLSPKHTCFGTVEGLAGEGTEWEEDYVLVLVKVKKDDAMEIIDNALVKLQW